MIEQELVRLVDDNNNEVDTTTRGEMHTKRLTHHATSDISFSTFYLGCHDVASGGVVLAGER